MQSYSPACLVVMLSALSACAPAQDPPDPAAVAAIEAFIDAAGQPEDVQTETITDLLADDFYYADPEGDADLDGISALLTARIDGSGPLTQISEMDGHHDIMRVWVERDGVQRWLFAELAEEDHKIEWIALFDPAPDDVDDTDPQITAYQDAWNTRDADERTVMLEQSWSVDGRYVDPNEEALDRDSLDVLIADFRDGLPGAKVKPKSGAAIHHGFVHFRWLTKGMAGMVRVHGVDIGRIDDAGQLSFIGGFFGKLDPDD